MGCKDSPEKGDEANSGKPSNFEAQMFRGRVFVDGSVYLALRTDGKHITNLPI